ncbi:polyamine aminopropyltransferase [Alicyclobacillus tolerans]|uniref:polyamine aminopropyltransferase n=1 Tax=Alicyclobacillus tolerans TaxID=90970 RepID=UPI001F31598D|nr:polyamine aminopropyltransferase [Alicyclobacillus tolerans]MCF8565639.1 polyamine aminopropyltransferase [Alicyclobacillus tolerans]
MDLWFTEYQNENLSIGLRIKQTLHSEKTEFQDLDVVETEQYGRLLVLDGCVMTTDKDEFVYHEMISHVPLHTHPNPKRVLVVGGGDGGVIREIIKHPSVEKAVLAEIDGRVIEASKEYFPHIASGLSDPRVDVQVTDGIKYVKDHPGEFDVILVDSTDPIGPAVGLFAKEFYQSVYDALKPDGLFVAQTESPFANQSLIKNVFSDVKSVFKQAYLYLAFVPTYPTGMWSFTMGSKQYDPREPQALRPKDTKYYSTAVHQAAFALPRFVEELVQS